MQAKGKNPHIERASKEQLSELLEGKSSHVREIYFAAHQLMLETLPDVVHSTDCKDGVTGYGARQYGYDGWGMAALAPHTRWTSLLFLHGVDLDDREGLLEGTGKKMRHVKLHSMEQFEQQRDTLRDLIEQAARLHLNEA